MVSPYETARMLRGKYESPQKAYIKLVPDSEPNADGEWKEVPYQTPFRFETRREFGAEYFEETPEGFHIVAITYSRPEDFNG